jgi:hypothetical protein
MKKPALSLLCFLLSIATFSQYKKEVVLKWAPGSLSVGKLTLGGEYGFKRKNSVEFIIGVPVAKNHHLQYDNNTSDLSSKAFSSLLGYRHYFGKKPVAGFYIEPYFKYLHHQASGMLEGELNGENAKFQSQTDYKGIGVGAQLGVQIKIAKIFRLDLFILGPEANSAKFSAIATDIASSIPWTLVEANEAENDIREVLKNIPIVGDKIEIQVDEANKTVITRYNGFVPGFRFGASIGVKL